MSRIVKRPVTVTLHENEPYSSTDREETHVIETVVDRWIEAGQWFKWDPHHYVFRVETKDMMVCDIERVGDQWLCYRIWDQHCVLQSTAD
jgi:hypothetical protein